MRRVLSVLLVLLAAAAVAVRWLGDRTVQPPEESGRPVFRRKGRHHFAVRVVEHLLGEAEITRHVLLRSVIDHRDAAQRIKQRQRQMEQRNVVGAVCEKPRPVVIVKKREETAGITVQAVFLEQAAHAAPVFAAAEGVVQLEIERVVQHAPDVLLEGGIFLR